MDEEQIIRCLATMPFHDFVATVQKAIRQRPESETGDAAHAYVYGLGFGVRYKDVQPEDGIEDVWEYSIAASPDHAVYGNDAPDCEPWCQFGQCGNCDLELVGAAKKVICPNCGAQAYLT